MSRCFIRFFSFKTAGKCWLLHGAVQNGQDFLFPAGWMPFQVKNHKPLNLVTAQTEWLVANQIELNITSSVK
jgi:hypothetical protein